MLFFYESNDSLQERDSFDDDLGLETSMGKLKIENRGNKKKLERIPRKKNHHWHYSPQQVQGESS